MKPLRLAYQFFLPVGLALVAILATAATGLGWYQAHHMEESFRENLVNLASASGIMIHSSAETFCKERGMAFLRFRETQEAEGELGSFERASLQAFKADPTLKHRELTFRTPSGETRMAVVAPARLTQTCLDCHQAFGLDATFQGRKSGELVAGFGVTAPMTELEQHERALRLAAAGASIAMLAVIGLILATVIRRTILKPIQALVTVLGRMADGDLRNRAEVHRADELGMLATALNRMAEQLGGALRSVSESSQRVASGSTQLAASASEMSRTMQETAQTGTILQSAGLKVRQAVSSLDGNIQTLESHARQTALEAGLAVSETREGTRSGQNAATGMAEIRQTTDRIVHAVRVIQDLARQTNLLSLNAAIEAAKAGQHGKGFAVVAEEVRKLAERSAGAAKEIEAIIAQTQDAVQAGVANVSDTLSRLDTIEQRIQTVSMNIQDIGNLSTTQLETSRDVGSLMARTGTQLDQNAAATHQLSASVQEVTRTADELDTVARQLREVVLRFRV